MAGEPPIVSVQLIGLRRGRCWAPVCGGFTTTNHSQRQSQWKPL